MDIIVSADDFGYSPDTVAVTVEALESGVATGASIMVGMPATGAAVEFARTRTDITFGAHLVFVQDGDARPLLPARDVPNLVDGRGRFRETNRVRLDAVLRRLPVEEIERELEAQIVSLLECGVAVRYVDSHRHIHKLPIFQSALCRVLPRLGITRVRGVQDIYLGPHPLSPTYWLGSRWRKRLGHDFATTDHTFMPPAGNDGWPERLLDKLDGVSGSLEIGIHPGSSESWRRMQSTSARAFVARALERGHGLVSWADIEMVDTGSGLHD